jgi:transposase-like protein
MFIPLRLSLERGYTRDWLPAYSFVLRARAMVLTGERTLSDTSGARQYCPRARQTAADNYVYRLSGVLNNRVQRAHQRTGWDAKLRHSPSMPATEKHKLVYETPNYVISNAAARWYHCTTVNYRDSSVRGYHDKTVLPCGVSPCPCS